MFGSIKNNDYLCIINLKQQQFKIKQLWKFTNLEVI